LRITIPSLTNETVGIIKNTSLALAVGVTELAYQAKYIDAYYFRGVEALAAASAIYLVLCLSMSGISGFLSNRFSRFITT
jgi:ABC-type amino acid transport system permease subunit